MPNLSDFTFDIAAMGLKIPQENQPQSLITYISIKQKQTRMWVNAQRDGRPADHRWRTLFNAAKFG